MTIDTSNLSSEQRAFLKATPNLLESLETEIPKQVTGAIKQQVKMNKSKAKWQHDSMFETEARSKAEALRQKFIADSDKNLREINEKLMKGKVISISELVCPVCGDSDHRNKMSGKPWCIKCNSPLVPKSKVNARKNMPQIKVLPKNLKDELRRLNPGLYGEDKK